MSFKLVVYGTLKKGYGNHRLIEGSDFISDVKIPGMKLFYSSGSRGFPVAKEDSESFLSGELYEISEETLRMTDFLENEGVMYDRKKISCEGNQAFIYIGNPKFWTFSKMDECPSHDNTYVWK